jgi:hypothetical protein
MYVTWARKTSITDVNSYFELQYVVSKILTQGKMKSEGTQLKSKIQWHSTYVVEVSQTNGHFVLLDSLYSLIHCDKQDFMGRLRR